MPIAVRRDPFQQVQVTPLRLPQARVMSVLMPPDGTAPVDWPLCDRTALAAYTGFTAISGSVNRALKGIRPGSSSGDAHLGLLALGYVVEVVIDTEGVTEVCYKATPAGVAAFKAYIAINGPLPKRRDPSTCTNKNQGKGENHRSKRG